MSQDEQVLAYIKGTGSITSMDAFTALGCTRLSARIYNLKKRGHKITKDYETGVNRDGLPVRYARYRIAKGGAQECAQ